MPRWTNGEDEALAEAARGTPAAESHSAWVSAVHETACLPRSRSAVRQRLYRLGLFPDAREEEPQVLPPAARWREELGQQVRCRREEGGLSRRRLAERAGVGEQTIRRLERGVGNPTIEVLVFVAAALGTTLPELWMKGEE